MEMNALSDVWLGPAPRRTRSLAPMAPFSGPRDTPKTAGDIDGKYNSGPRNC